MNNHVPVLTTFRPLRTAGDRETNVVLWLCWDSARHPTFILIYGKCFAVFCPSGLIKLQQVWFDMPVGSAPITCSINNYCEAHNTPLFLAFCQRDTNTLCGHLWGFSVFIMFNAQWKKAIKKPKQYVECD